MGSRIFHRAGLAFCCWSRLSSNVRHRRATMRALAHLNSAPGVRERQHGRDAGQHKAGFPALVEDRELGRLVIEAARRRLQEPKTWSASIRSAGRGAIVAHGAGSILKVSLWCRRRASHVGAFKLIKRRLKDNGPEGWRLGHRSVFHALIQSHCTTRQPAPHLLRITLPNPSFEARPNGKPPGPGHRYGVHFL